MRVVGGRLKGRNIVAPTSRDIRPTADRLRESVFNILTHAYRAGASGYLAGRAIWLDAFRKFPDWSAIRDGLQGEAVSYMHELNMLTDGSALPFHEHACYEGRGGRFHPQDETFRHVYSGL